MLQVAKTIYNKVVDPLSDEALRETLNKAEPGPPTLWLLGKTGVGKSSLVRRLTGDSAVEIGKVFRPSTSSSLEYRFQREHPVIRFLDTRGLDETGYEPKEDIEELTADSHALIIVISLSDYEQSGVLHALKAIQHWDREQVLDHALVVFCSAPEETTGRERHLSHHMTSLRETLGIELPYCVVDSSLEPSGEGDFSGDEKLRNELSRLLPRLRLFLAKESQATNESRAFERLKPDVLWYATVAAATDVIPVAGLVTVPAVQGKLLHSLGQQYGVEWDRRAFASFTGALGGGFALAYGASLTGRQASKLIPVWGPVAGTALSMSISYATTFALGRAACYYLHKTLKENDLDKDELRRIYDEALNVARAPHKQDGEGADA